MNTLPISILLLPSMRSVAYLDAFRTLGIVPESCILMAGGIPHFPGICAENDTYRYDHHLFDVKLDIGRFLADHQVPIHRVDARNVNEEAVIEAVRQCGASTLVYTGGGILKDEILGLGKSFIHVHPGITPEYRGSTCFYYSLLNNRRVGATAFVMNRGIDTGNVIVQQQFRVNYLVQADQPLFMDYILDPFIRAYALKQVLEIFLATGRIEDHPLDVTASTPYYVMHPLLRHLAIQRLNSAFDPAEEVGILPQSSG